MIKQTTAKTRGVKYYPPLTERLRSPYKELTKYQKAVAKQAMARHFGFSMGTVDNKLYGTDPCKEIECLWMEQYVERIKNPVHTATPQLA